MLLWKSNLLKYLKYQTLQAFKSMYLYIIQVKRVLICILRTIILWKAILIIIGKSLRAFNEQRAHFYISLVELNKWFHFVTHKYSNRLDAIALQHYHNLYHTNSFNFKILLLIQLDKLIIVYLEIALIFDLGLKNYLSHSQR